MIAFRTRIMLIGAATFLLVALIAGVVLAALGARHHRPAPAPTPPTTGAALSPHKPAGFRPVPPLTDAPSQTPVQQQYDAALASGLAGSSSVVTAEQAPVPAPGFSPPWPALPVADTAEQWVQAFSRELLDIDFAHQTRSGLGAWLSAEEAPELLPGVPAQIQDKILYLSVFDTGGLGGGASPIPDQAGWDTNARARVRWAVSNLTVQADPEFSQIVGSGWQPVDQRFAVEDVTGLLTVTGTGSSTQHSFSMAVGVGSARWHPGYGTVLVEGWKEN